MAEQDLNVEALVLTAIEAVRSGDRDTVSRAYEALAPIETGEVIAELFVWVDDLVDGIDVDELLDSVALPLPPKPHEVLASVESRDLRELQDAVGTDRPERIFATLLVLVAALKNARESRPVPD